MNRHDDLRLLLLAFAAEDRKHLLQQEAFAKTGFQALHLLCHKPDLTAAEAARRLCLSAKQYQTICAKTYDYLKEVLLQTKKRHSAELQVLQLQALAEAQKESGQFTQSRKTFSKAIEVAQHYELHAREINLHYQLQQVAFYQSTQAAKDVAQLCLERVADLVQQQAQTAQLRQVYNELLVLRYKYALCILPDEQEQLALLMQQLHTVAPEAPGCITARIYFYQAHLLICFMLGQPNRILEFNDALLQCWQQSRFVQLHPELFIRSASLQAYTHFLANDIKRVTQFLEHYTGLAERFLTNPWHQHWFDVIQFHTTLKVLHKTFQYEQLKCFFAEAWPRTYGVLHVLPAPEKIDILLSSCITFFALRQWAEAEALILEIKEANRYLKRSDTLYFTFVFHCLILFEQREWSRLHSLINSEYHFLYRNKTLRPFERDMLLFIKKLPLITISTNGKRSLKAFLQKLDTYKQHPVHKLHFAYFDFYTWVESKTEGLNYMELVRRKAAQNNLAAA